MEGWGCGLLAWSTAETILGPGRRRRCKEKEMKCNGHGTDTTQQGTPHLFFFMIMITNEDGWKEEAGESQNDNIINNNNNNHDKNYITCYPRWCTTIDRWTVGVSDGVEWNGTAFLLSIAAYRQRVSARRGLQGGAMRMKRGRAGRCWRAGRLLTRADRQTDSLYRIYSFLPLRSGILGFSGVAFFPREVGWVGAVAGGVPSMVCLR